MCVLKEEPEAELGIRVVIAPHLVVLALIFNFSVGAGGLNEAKSLMLFFRSGSTNKDHLETVISSVSDFSWLCYNSMKAAGWLMSFHVSQSSLRNNQSFNHFNFFLILHLQKTVQVRLLM